MTRKLFPEEVDPLVDHYDETERDTLQTVGRRQDGHEHSTPRALHSTAFVLEVVVILLFIVLSMAVVCSMFGKAYQIDQEADTLTRSIMLATTGAENGAETFEADPDDPDCPEQTMYVFEGSSFKQVDAYVPGVYVVRRVVETDDTGTGTLYRASIGVSRYNETVYLLSVATYESNGRTPRGGGQL